jgi:hypothetical protein
LFLEQFFGDIPIGSGSLDLFNRILWRAFKEDVVPYPRVQRMLPLEYIRGR